MWLERIGPYDCFVRLFRLIFPTVWASKLLCANKGRYTYTEQTNKGTHTERQVETYI